MRGGDAFPPVAADRHARVLGDVRAVGGGRSVPLTGESRRLLFGLLALHSPEPVPVQRIVDALWPEPPRRARTAVQVQVHRLRRALAEVDGSSAWIHTAGDGYALAGHHLQVDVATFRQQLRDGLRLLSAGHTGAGLAHLRHADAGWHGEPFGSADRHTRDWPEVRALIEERWHGLEAMFAAELTIGRDAELVSGLRAAVTRFPERERLHELLITCLYRAGRQLAATNAFRAYRSWTVDTLGLEPGPSIQALHQAVLRHDPALIGPARERVAVTERTAGPEVGREASGTLLRAADFAERMGGHGQVAECLGLILRGMSGSDPRRPSLLLRLGHARMKDTGTGADEATEALRLFTDRLDHAGIAGAEILHANIAWCRRDRPASVAALHRARAAMARTSAEVVPALTASLVGLLAVTGQPVEAARIAGRRLAPDAQALPEQCRARLHGNRAIARLSLGDGGAADDLRAAVAGHERSMGWVPVPTWVNVMDAAMALGDLRGFGDALDRALAVARPRGSRLDLRYLDASRAWRALWCGDTEGASARVDRWLADDSSHFLQDDVLCLHARLRLLRGDQRGASRVIERLLRSAGEATTRSISVSRPLLAASLAVRRGERDQATGLIEEGLASLDGGFLPAGLGVELPRALAACGMGRSVLAAAADSPWREAAQRYLDGDRPGAARIYRSISSMVDAEGCLTDVSRPG
ncbi:BTAD domain-containing putative transcriptional regulator [Micromonospora sp. NPDC000089]|uniref:BTAD domain-containing putative transcriptional regulator n=1 Tax=unclassified Micromonospora TaxID=2617518 RepID=UPI0036B91B5D